MATYWLVADAVRDALGVHVDRVLGDVVDVPGLGCRVCHRVHDSDRRLVDTVVLLRLAAPGRSRALVGFAHASCAPPSGVVDVLGTEDEIPRDSRAIAGECNLEGVVTPLLAYDPGERPYVETNGELSDLFAAAMLRRGFDLLRGPVGTAALGRAPGWTVTATGTQVRLAGPDRVVLEPTLMAGFGSDWDRLTRRVGWVLVVAGSGIVLRDGGAGPARLAEATAAGRVVAALVRATDESAAS